MLLGLDGSTPTSELYGINLFSMSTLSLLPLAKVAILAMVASTGRFNSCIRPPSSSTRSLTLSSFGRYFLATMFKPLRLRRLSANPLALSVMSPDLSDTTFCIRLTPSELSIGMLFTASSNAFLPSATVPILALSTTSTDPAFCAAALFSETIKPTVAESWLYRLSEIRNNSLKAVFSGLVDFAENLNNLRILLNSALSKDVLLFLISNESIRGSVVASPILPVRTS